MLAYSRRPNQDGGDVGLRSSTPWGVYVYYVYVWNSVAQRSFPTLVVREHITGGTWKYLLIYFKDDK